MPWNSGCLYIQVEGYKKKHLDLTRYQKIKKDIERYKRYLNSETIAENVNTKTAWVGTQLLVRWSAVHEDADWHADAWHAPDCKQHIVLASLVCQRWNVLSLI